MDSTFQLAPVLHAWLSEGWRRAHGIDLPSRGWAACPLPQNADLTHAGALLAARGLGQSPRVVADAWVEALSPHPFVTAVEAVGPGHLNLRLSPSGWKALLAHGPAAFETPAVPPPTLVEFVSANPTGPLHLGHARQAVLGDVLARLLKRLGGPVATEFFYNDAGAQIDRLEESVRLRAEELGGAALAFERDGAQAEALPPDTYLFPSEGYHGAYATDIAQAWLHQGGRPTDAGLRAFAIAAIQAEQQADLAHLGVVFDGRVSERSLHEDGRVARTVAALRPHAYQALQPNQADGPPPTDAQPAWFLQTTRWGDDKDRVMVKADGSVTYFVPDVAYHLDKWARGWKRAINLQGSDHHGTLARVRAGVQAVDPTIGPAYPQVLFHTMIRVVKDGRPVKASKRAGDYVTARDVAEQVGVDAFRLAMLDKKPDTPMVLDVDAWLNPCALNPVHSIQYAHARLCSALDKASAAPLGPESAPDWHPAERALLVQLALWESRLGGAALDADPVRAAHLVREMASTVHESYQKGPRLIALDAPSREARVGLYGHAINRLRAASALLGIGCPERMHVPEAAPASPLPRPSPY